MTRTERDRTRLERERVRKRNYFLIRLAGVCLLAFIGISLLLPSVTKALSAKGKEFENISQGEGGIPAVGGEIFEEGPRLSDPLLVLVNRENPLPESWQTELVAAAGEEQVDFRVSNDLTNLLRAADEDGVTLWIASAYRSIALQEDLLARAVQENMDQLGMSEEEARAEALLTINPPGCSEHHTGLAVDFNDVSDDFETTDAYDWLTAHAAEYGFIQRYKRSKADVTGISNESWHYRYVGREYAQEMERLDLCLEEYREYLQKQFEGKAM